jgi:hypothetical protein
MSIDFDFEVDDDTLRKGLERVEHLMRRRPGRILSWLEGDQLLGDIENHLFDFFSWLTADQAPIMSPGRIPIYVLARELEAVRSLPVKQRVRLHLPPGSDVDITLVNDNAYIETLGGRKAVVPYSELLEAWAALASKVRSFFEEYVPALLEHPVIRGTLDDVLNDSETGAS